MRQDRQLSLDGLRAICAASVVVFHAAPELMVGGSLGVDVFFVLSGFLITRILLSERDKTGSINVGRFYLSRAARLWPALLAFTAVYACVVLVLKVGDDRAEKLKAALYAATYVMNIVQAFDLGPRGQLLHTWSLAIEQQFYLLWPLAMIVMQRGRVLSDIASLLALCIAWRFILVAEGATIARIYNGLDTRLDGLLIGGLLAAIPDRSAIHRIAGRTWAIPAIALAALAFTFHVDGSLTLGLMLPVVSVLAGWLVIGLRVAEPACLTVAPLVYLGSISYGIYLWHFPIAILLRHHLWAPPFVAAAGALLTSTALAAGSFHFLETPARKWIMGLGAQQRTAAA